MVQPRPPPESSIADRFGPEAASFFSSGEDDEVGGRVTRLCSSAGYLVFGCGRKPRIRYQLTGPIPDRPVEEKLGGHLGPQLPISFEQPRGVFAQRQSLLEQRSRLLMQGVGLPAAGRHLLAILAAARCGAMLGDAVRHELEGRV